MYVQCGGRLTEKKELTTKSRRPSNSGESSVDYTWFFLINFVLSMFWQIAMLIGNESSRTRSINRPLRSSFLSPGIQPNRIESSFFFNFKITLFFSRGMACVPAYTCMNCFCSFYHDSDMKWSRFHKYVLFFFWALYRRFLFGNRTAFFFTHTHTLTHAKRKSHVKEDFWAAVANALPTMVSCCPQVQKLRVPSYFLSVCILLKGIYVRLNDD